MGGGRGADIIKCGEWRGGAGRSIKWRASETQRGRRTQNLPVERARLHA